MALDYLNTYPGQVTPDAAYPQGKPKNEGSEGDGSGTPWEEQLVQDLFGFWQALLKKAGITPSGSPDTADASDYLNSVLQFQKDVITGSHYGDSPNFYFSENWATTHPGAATPGIATQIGTASTNPLWVPIRMPFASPIPSTKWHKDLKITGFGATIKPASGHGGLPTQPRVQIYSWLPGVAPITHGSLDKQDAQADVPSYEAAHTVGQTGLSLSLNGNSLTYPLWAKITGESGGGNFLPFLTVQGVWVTFGF